EEEYQNRPKKNVFLKRYKIQEVIRRGQIVLVQVIKEERGNKGASLTTYLSLAGRYCVLMPNSPKDGGISRKIASGEDRKRLKAISTELRLAEGMSVIIRTAGMDRTRAEIKRDFDYLVKLWNQIREDTLVSNAPALIYEESDIIKRAIRDQYTGDIDELVVEGDEGYHTAREFMKLLLPSHTPKIKHYKEATPLFYAYNVEEQLLSMYDPVVKLRSGGYLVINPTEALISIDVNSGRATGERNIEETALRTNMEAAAEVARQLRLRDLAGLVVIDFIDMMESRNRRSVEKCLKDALKADRAKIQLGRISPFGLLEMSRQRIRPSISDSHMVSCEHCQGRGVIRSHESMSIQMIRAIEKEASAGVWSTLRLISPQDVALHLLNTKRDVLRLIEQRHGITIQVLIDGELALSEFNLEKMRRSQGERSEGPRRERGERGGRDRGERGERPERSERPERGGDRGRDRDRERERSRERVAVAEASMAEDVLDVNETVEGEMTAEGTREGA
ncbi:MAG: Rne/Rng family ribonuclease, partial [Rickettsiales bacterium]|nr:Rne/Rng family ribonuclease [Rickettsiales bacterium]